MPFDGSSHTDIHTALPFTREDYLDFVDKAGRALRDDNGINAGVLPFALRASLRLFKTDPVGFVITHYGVAAHKCRSNF